MNYSNLNIKLGKIYVLKGLEFKESAWSHIIPTEKSRVSGQHELFKLFIIKLGREDTLLVQQDRFFDLYEESEYGRENREG